MTPARGEVWWVRLDPTLGSEIRKTRPALVMTADVLSAVIDQVRAVSRERLVSKIETASGEDVLAVGKALAVILELS